MLHYSGWSKLMAEVIKVVGNVANTQVIESTRGLKPGDQVEFTNHMLEVKLGPECFPKTLMAFKVI
jgi:V/A-type H+-transporting ATPase subunit A